MIERATKSGQIHNQLAFQSRLIKLIHKNHTLEEQFQLILDEVEQSFDRRLHCSIFIKRDEHTFVHLPGPSISGQTKEISEAIESNIESVFSKKTAATKKEIIDNIEREPISPELKWFFKQKHIQSISCLPLLNDGDQFGLLVLFFEKKALPSDAEVELIHQYTELIELIFEVNESKRDQSEEKKSSHRLFDMEEETNLDQINSFGLYQAIMNNQFYLEYQPKLSLKGKEAAIEALVRWNHPVMGVVPPSSFIPIAEKTSMIKEIGKWVLYNACMEVRELHRQGMTDLRLSVNISVEQLNDSNIIEEVSTTLKETEFPASKLQLEITESVFMKNMEDIIPRLEGLHDLGIQILIDDFGTYYSSLSYLTQLPIQGVKLDRSFINRIHVDVKHKEIMKMLVELSHKLKLTITAEGIETEEQFDFVRSIGCDEIQGFYISKPLDPKSLAEFF